MAKMRSNMGAISIDPADLQSLRAALRRIAKVAPDELTKGAMKVAGSLATEARNRLAASSQWGRLVAPSVKPTRQRIPAIVAGGRGQAREKRSPGDDPSFGALFFGAEYGVKSDPRWPGHPWKGSGESSGYGLWPAVRQGADKAFDEWTNELMMTVDRIWSHH